MTLDTQLTEYFRETDAAKRGVMNKPYVCPQEKAFILADGSRLNSLSLLQNALARMDEWVFTNHVNRDKNDFAVWVLDVFDEARLAKELKRSRTRKGMLDKLRKRLS